MRLWITFIMGIHIWVIKIRLFDYIETNINGEALSGSVITGNQAMVYFEVHWT